MLEKSISIDENFINQKRFEQTFFWQNNELWINIVSPNINYYINTNNLEESLEEIKICLKNYIPFKRLNNFERSEENCISIILYFENSELNYRIEPNLVKLSHNLSYLVADKILNKINLQSKFHELEKYQQDCEFLKEQIENMQRFALHLKTKRLGHSLDNIGLNSKDNLFKSWHISHEFSLFANHVLGKYMYDNISELKKLPLAINGDFLNEKSNQLNDFLSIKNSFNKNSQYMMEKLHFIITNKIHRKEDFQKDSNIYPIYVYDSVFERFQEIVRNIVESNNQNKFHLVRAWKEELSYLAVKEDIYPEFVLFRFDYISVRNLQAEYCKMKIYDRNDLNESNSIFFAENYKLNTHASRPLADPLKFLTNQIIYLNLLKAKNKIYLAPKHKIIFKIINEKDTSGLENSSKIITDLNNFNHKTTSCEIFNKQLMQKTVVVKYEKLEDNVIYYLKFPLSMSFYKVSINSAINVTAFFSKYENYDQTNIDSIEFNIKIDASNNFSNETELTELELESDSFKRVLTEMQLDSFRNNDIIQNIELYENFIKGNTQENTQLNLTLNSRIKLKVKLNTKNGLVLPVQFHTDGANLINYINNKNFHFDNEQKPDIQQIKFTEDFFYCLTHHQFAKNNDIWIIKNIFIEISEKKIEATIRKTKFTDKYWNSDSKLNYNHVCISKNKMVNKTNTTEDEILVSDKNYILVFHGIITKKEEILVQDKEMIKLLVEIKNNDENKYWDRFNHEVKLLSDLTFDFEIYSSEEVLKNQE